MHESQTLTLRRRRATRRRPIASNGALYDLDERTVTEEEIRTSFSGTAALRELSQHCIAGNDFESCLQKFVETAIAVTGAQKGNLQVLDEQSGSLRIAAQRGFKRPFLQFFASVACDENSACAASMRSATRVVIEDVRKSKIFRGHPSLRVMLDAGVTAVHSMPLLSSLRNVRGMLSVHFAKPHRPSEHELRFMDLISRHAADYLERKRAERLVTELQREIRRRKGLEGHIVELTDLEQQRLGRQLHDGLCQQLTGIAFRARARARTLKGDTTEHSRDLEEIAQLINACVVDVRDIARDLNKSEIEAVEFTDALRELVRPEIWSTPCRLTLKTKVEIDDDKIALQIYRILREAILNANKHSQATQITLNVRRLRNEFVFTVADNGIGFDGNKRHEGQGIRIMNYRAQLIGARFRVGSRNGGGASVALHLPVGK